MELKGGGCEIYLIINGKNELKVITPVVTSTPILIKNKIKKEKNCLKKTLLLGPCFKSGHGQNGPGS